MDFEVNEPEASKDKGASKAASASANDNDDKASSGPRIHPSHPSSPQLRKVTLSPGNATASRGEAALPPGQSRAPTQRPPEDEEDPYVGATVDGRYYVEKQLGEGGMGVVYLCRHTIIDKKVAMKVLRADMARNEEVTERFLNEARSASSIGNAHIIDISDFGRLPDGATYFVMEFLSGIPLADLADARIAIDPSRVAHISIQLSQGLSAAHDAGIIHRDLKPDNIFLIKQGAEEEFVKILDFGIAKATSSTTKLTQAGQVFGTPHYMSPEQASGMTVDNRSDIYALGVIMYELSTGVLPFDADNFMGILSQHMYKEPVPPLSIEGPTLHFPPGFEELILKCMAKAAEDRYQSMKELGDDIKRVFAGVLPFNSQNRLSIPDIGGSTGPLSAPPASLSPSSAHHSPSSSAAPESNPALLFKAQSAPKEERSIFREKLRRYVHPSLQLYGAIGFTAATFAALSVWFLSPSSKEEMEGPLSPSPQQEPTTPAPIAQPEQITPEATQVVEPSATKSVLLAVAPLKAHVFEGKTDLGESPLTIEVGTRPLELEIRLKGYKTHHLLLDGKTQKISVDLEKSASKRPIRRRQRPRLTPKKEKSLGGSELVNPW